MQQPPPPRCRFKIYNPPCTNHRFIVLNSLVTSSTTATIGGEIGELKSESIHVTRVWLVLVFWVTHHRDMDHLRGQRTPSLVELPNDKSPAQTDYLPNYLLCRLLLYWRHPIERLYLEESLSRVFHGTECQVYGIKSVRTDCRSTADEMIFEWEILFLMDRNE